MIASIMFSFLSAQGQQSIGIGTTSPDGSSILDISSTTDGLLIPRMTYSQRTGIGTPAPGLMVYQTNAVALFQSGLYYFDGSLWKRFARSDEIAGGGNNSWTTSADNQYSNLAGNVGIGTTSPSSKFHLVGNLLQESGTLTLNNTNATITLQNGGVNRAFMQLSGNNFRIGNYSNNSAASFIVRMNGSDRMTIDSVGNMGLGTTSPNASAKLDIASTTKGILLPRMTTANMFAIPTPTAGLLVYNTDYNEFYQYTGSNWKPILNGNYWSRPITNRDRIANTADSIGIGTSGPLAKLHITGGTFANYTTQNGYIMLGSASGLNMAIGNYEILARDNGNEAPLFLQQDGGPVRIGATGLTFTDTKLHISDGAEAGLTTNGYLAMGLTTGESIAMDNNDIQARDGGTSTYLKVQQSSGPGLQVGFFNTQTLPDTKLYIPSGDDASYTLDGLIHLGIKTAFNLVMDENEILARNAGNPATLILQNDGGDLKVGSGNKLYVGTNGNVGIGTGSPLAKLDVAGAIRVVQNGAAISVDGDDPHIDFWRNGAFRSWIGQYANEMYIASNDKLHIDADQIAIGTVQSTADNYKLTVTGKIICEELKVELTESWPDYVFADHYALTPLHELKSFIDTNDHLPNIPKASDVERDGFEVGEMNRKLLEKVEELTLYVISLQEQIDQLKSNTPK